jgi:D-alanyl-D-alanine dipeptidase
MFFIVFYIIGAWLGTNVYPEIADYTYLPSFSGSGDTYSALAPLSPPSSDYSSLTESLLDYPVPAYGVARNPYPRYKSREELRLESYGLVNVRGYVPDVVVRSIFATHNNMLGVKLYDYNEIYLHPKAAIKLANAQEILRNANPNIGIVIYDAVRPMYIQNKCWGFAKLRGLEGLFTPPCQVSMHSYGVAVDVGLIDLSTYHELDMGGRVDDVTGKLADIRQEELMLMRGVLTTNQLYNRLLLRNAMRAAGFTPIANEWWHFDAVSRYQAHTNFTAIP